MAAGYSDQYLEQGASFNSQLTLTDDYGVRYDLTNYTISSRAKKSYTTSNVAFTFIAQVSDPILGLITLSLDAPTTANVPYGKYVYDVIIQDTVTNLITRVLEGQIYVAPGVTGVTNSYGTDA
jgi:hypothetical protein